MNQNILKQQHILKYMTAGRAIFTAQGHSHRFTFKVKQPTFRNGEKPEKLRFVYVLNGPRYVYVGTLTKRNHKWVYNHSDRTIIAKDSLCIVAFRYILEKVTSGLLLPPSVTVWHHGSCGKCGRTLTVPESIETGVGPICENSRK